MLAAIAIVVLTLMAVSITLMIVALRARQDRKSARLFLLRGPWRWRK